MDLNRKISIKMIIFTVTKRNESTQLRGGHHPSVIASAAKQSRAACGLLRCFAPRNDKGRGGGVHT
jgi:hypothetical protein